MPAEFSKDTDGFLAKHFDRHISGAISRQLIKTPITPNQITVAVTLLGVYAGTVMAQPNARARVIGSFLFLLTSILDGCDGEVARAKKMFSKLGGWLDLWGDNVVHIAVFYGLGLGLAEEYHNSTYQTLGAIAAVGTFVAAALASWQTYRAGKSSFTSVAGDARSQPPTGWKQTLVRLSDALARRDFIYGVVVLALIDQLHWFLWATALGVTVYVVVLLLLALVLPAHRS